jgi:cytochrome c-type biogenesis protein
MDGALIISAFSAGLLTFLAPCTLPLVPAYLGFISGVNDPRELQDRANLLKLRRRLMANALAFIFGFTLVFTAFGLLAGTLGHLLGGSYRDNLSRFGGLIIIVFGLMLIGTLQIPFLQRTFKIKIPARLQAGKPVPSFFIGLALAFGWSPCIGPILGTILTLAASTNTALAGGFLLVVFSLGLAVPFLIVAFSIGSAFKIIKALSRYAHLINVVAGLLLIVIGILMLSGQFGVVAQFIEQTLGVNYFEVLSPYL